MRNLFTISSKNASKLQLKIGGGYHFENGQTIALKSYMNIYITNEEKFVEDEYVTDGIEVIKASSKLVNAQGLVDRRDWKKIILTTDFELIEDGVQDIGEYFVRWFVDNSKCECVEVIYEPKNFFDSKQGWEYTILINEQFCNNCGNDKCCCIVREETAPYWELVDKKAVLSNTIDLDAYAKGVQDGVEWQEKRSYTEEEIQFNVNKLMNDLFKGKMHSNMIAGIVNEWFETFKKK